MLSAADCDLRAKQKDDVSKGKRKARICSRLCDGAVDQRRGSACLRGDVKGWASWKEAIDEGRGRSCLRISRDCFLSTKRGEAM